MPAQLVPYVIWQTWKSTHPRPLRFKGMNSIVQVRRVLSFRLRCREQVY